MSKKVLIVDDSRMFRSIIKQVLQKNKEIEIIGEADNGKSAIELIEKKWPDFITLDVEMPILNGLETLKQIKKIEKRKKRKCNVIMLSSLTKKGADTTIETLEEGAFDFIAKPVMSNISESLNYLKQELIPKILTATTIKQFKANPKATFVKSNNLTSGKIEVITIGVSTGGPKALGIFLPELTKKIKIPILIVQHMPPTFTKSLAESLDKKCSSNVVEAQQEMEIKSNTVYIAQGGKHMVIRERNGNKIIGITDSLPENNCKPSVDVLFRSAAGIYGNKLIAIILTGMGNDGSKSLSALKRKGAKIIVQDKETSVVWGMPGSAVATGLVDETLPLMNIPQKLEQLINSRS